MYTPPHPTPPSLSLHRSLSPSLTHAGLHSFPPIGHWLPDIFAKTKQNLIPNPKNDQFLPEPNLDLTTVPILSRTLTSTTEMPQAGMSLNVLTGPVSTHTTLYFYLDGDTPI